MKRKLNKKLNKKTLHPPAVDVINGIQLLLQRKDYKNQREIADAIGTDEWQLSRYVRGDLKPGDIRSGIERAIRQIAARPVPLDRRHDKPIVPENLTACPAGLNYEMTKLEMRCEAPTTLQQVEEFRLKIEKEFNDARRWSASEDEAPHYFVRRRVWLLSAALNGLLLDKPIVACLSKSDLLALRDLNDRMLCWLTERFTETDQAWPHDAALRTFNQVRIFHQGATAYGQGFIAKNLGDLKGFKLAIANFEVALRTQPQDGIGHWEDFLTLCDATARDERFKEIHHFIATEIIRIAQTVRPELARPFDKIEKKPALRNMLRGYEPQIATERTIRARGGQTANPLKRASLVALVVFGSWLTLCLSAEVLTQVAESRIDNSGIDENAQPHQTRLQLTGKVREGKNIIIDDVEPTFAGKIREGKNISVDEWMPRLT